MQLTLTHVLHELRRDLLADGGDARSWSVEQLAEHLYRRFYACSHGDVAGAGTLFDALYESPLATACVSAGWRVRERLDQRVLLERDGEYVVMPEPWPEGRDEVLLGRVQRFQSGYVRIEPGREREDDAPDVRFYVNLHSATLLEAAVELGRLTDAAGCAMKIADGSAHNLRLESAVLYCPRPRAEALARALGQLVRDAPGLWRAGTPLFTLPLCESVSCADCPSSGESFGELCCSMLAHAVGSVVARPEVWVDAAARAAQELWAQHGLELDRPWSLTGQPEALLALRDAFLDDAVHLSRFGES